MKTFLERVVALGGSNLALKALSLIIAVGLWVAGHRDTERAVEVPVEFRNIPADLMVTDNRVDYVVLRLMGPRTLVSTLDADKVKLSLELDGAQSGLVSYPLAADNFNIPRGISVARITPPVIHLRLEPVSKRTLPVSVRLSGKPSAGYRVAQATASPATVVVQGPADEVRRLAVMETIAVDVEETRGSIKRRVRLSNDGKPLTIAPDQVDVVVTIEEEQMTRTFEHVDVQAKAFTGVYRVLPPSVTLRVSGPKTSVEKLKLTSNEVYLNLQGLSVGEHNVPLEFNLPAEVRVEEQKPSRFRVRISKPAE
jgi:hypothetical protein